MQVRKTFGTFLAVGFLASAIFRGGYGSEVRDRHVKEVGEPVLESILKKDGRRLRKSERFNNRDNRFVRSIQRPRVNQLDFHFENRDESKK